MIQFFDTQCTSLLSAFPAILFSREECVDLIELLHIECVLLYPVSQKSVSTKWRVYKGKIWTPDTSPSTHSISTNSMVDLHAKLGSLLCGGRCEVAKANVFPLLDTKRQPINSTCSCAVTYSTIDTIATTNQPWIWSLWLYKRSMVITTGSVLVKTILNQDITFLPE